MILVSTVMIQSFINFDRFTLDDRGTPYYQIHYLIQTIHHFNYLIFHIQKQ